MPVPWPGWNTNAWHDDAAKPQTVGTDTYWLGSLSVGMRDASGQMYMRNRYYNPSTGQFTQPDPIGLAGGLNSYGFAAGDPVSYSDPYGLMACLLGTNEAPCRSKDDAAKLAMQRNYAASVRSDTEFGGEILEVRPGEYMYTARVGSVDGVDIETSTPGFSGAWHTHGDFRLGYGSERFSGGPQDGYCCDKAVGDETQGPVYLITPSARMLRYDPDPKRQQNGQVTEIGRITPIGRAPRGSVPQEVQRQKAAGAMYRVY